MKNSKILFAVIAAILLTASFFLYKHIPLDNNITGSSLKIAGDSLIESNDEYLKDVRRSNDGTMAFEVPLSEIMGREQKYGPLKSLRIPKQGEDKEEGLDRKNLPQNPNSKEVSQYPVPTKRSQNNEPSQSDAPQTVGVNFNGANYSGTNPTGSFPPDDMGEVGPSQYIVFVNGRIVSFNKTTGTVDGIMNTTTDNFFASVMTPGAGTYCSDPRLRYDRLSKKWYFLIIDVPQPNANRVLLAVSPDSIITGSTVFRFFFYQHTVTFLDYPTLGVDANALYVGGNLFNLSTDAFENCNALVIRKSSIQGAGPMVTTNLGNVLVSNVGPYTPQGVDNPDPNATEGYFIGVDNATFGTLMIRRVSNPGGTPTISSNISLTVPTTSFPLKVPHSGNTGGNNGRLDALDDRLFMAQIRNGSIWTTHNIGVNSSGTTTSATRNGSRWYQVGNLSTTPTLTQSGTIYDNTTNAGSYWIPTIATSGQGHSAMVYSIAGASTRINMGSVGRFSSDVLGSMQTPLTITNNTTFAYNPGSDPGGAGGRRWGDYSSIRVDPTDDMTFWGIHQWCSGNNNYGCYVVQLRPPPPATPASTSPSTIPIGSSVAVTLTGTSASGSGFYDPGIGFTKHIGVSIDGGVVVNSVTYVNPTTLTLNVNTSGATQNTTRTVTVTNPDGQTAAATMFVVLPVELASFNSYVNKNDVVLKWVTSSEENNSGFDIERKKIAETNWNKIGFVTGKGNSTREVNYSYPDAKLETGKYNYRLKQIDYNGNYKYYDLSNEVEVGVPAKFSLYQNYPNPFNPETKINFELPASAKVSIKVYDISGKEVSVILNEQKTAGYYTAKFIANNISTGVYFYAIEAISDNGNRFYSVKKMILVK